MYTAQKIKGTWCKTMEQVFTNPNVISQLMFNCNTSNLQGSYQTRKLNEMFAEQDVNYK